MYRIIQAALTNARRHAPGAAVDVELTYTEAALVLRIRDNGPGPSPATAGAGHGLLGMRERAAAVGGRLATGLGPGRGFLIKASPVDEDLGDGTHRGGCDQRVGERSLLVPHPSPVGRIGLRCGALREEHRVRQRDSRESALLGCLRKRHELIQRDHGQRDRALHGSDHLRRSADGGRLSGGARRLPAHPTERTPPGIAHALGLAPSLMGEVPLTCGGDLPMTLLKSAHAGSVRMAELIVNRAHQPDDRSGRPVRDQVIGRIADHLTAWGPGHPLRVAVDGIAPAGKTPRPVP
ncbi:ATP-binding protein [Streptomyces sp. NPDC058221]|uniref:ATP-binding protein n=1 Tax=Streptomyces sp. NPDC058221 TaxID=3346388 RepID=UPI0036EAD0A2